MNFFLLKVGKLVKKHFKTSKSPIWMEKMVKVALLSFRLNSESVSFHFSDFASHILQFFIFDYKLRDTASLRMTL